MSGKPNAKCGPKGCAVPQRAPGKEQGWSCHLCPEVFDSLRELNDHNRDRKTLEPKRCANPTPAAPWYTERFEKLMAEIADLKARIKHARAGQPCRYVAALDLRKKAWRKG